jgi:flagellar motor switch protein FliG
MKRVVYFDELIYLDEAVLAELLSKVSPKVLAYSLRGISEEFREKMLRNLGIRDRRIFLDEEEKMNENFSQKFTAGAQKQVLRTARKLEAENKFVFEVVNSPRFQKRKKK